MVGITEGVFDTGTVGIVGDSISVYNLFNNLPGARQSQQYSENGLQAYTCALVLDTATYLTHGLIYLLMSVPCNSNSLITITVGTMNVVITPAVLNLGAIDSTQTNCLAGIFGANNLKGDTLAR